MSAQPTSPTEELLSFSPFIPAVVLLYFWAYAAVAWLAAVVLEEAVAAMASAICSQEQRKLPPSSLWSWLHTRECTRPPGSVALSLSLICGAIYWARVIMVRQCFSWLACQMGVVTKLSPFDGRNLFCIREPNHGGIRRLLVDSRRHVHPVRAAMGRRWLADGLDSRVDLPV